MTSNTNSTSLSKPVSNDIDSCSLPLKSILSNSDYSASDSTNSVADTDPSKLSLYSVIDEYNSDSVLSQLSSNPSAELVDIIMDFESNICEFDKKMEVKKS